MFDRFIRLAQAKKALREGRLEEAARLATDPLIATDRRAEEVRDEARERMRLLGQQRLAEGDPAAAVRELARAVALGADSSVRRQFEEAKQVVEQANDRLHTAQARLEAIRRLAERGQVGEAERQLREAGSQLQDLPALRQVEAFVLGRRTEARRLLDRARAAVAAGTPVPALESLEAARACDDAAGDPGLLAALVGAVVPELEAEVCRGIDSGDLVVALQAYRLRLQQLPQLVHETKLGAIGERLARAVLGALQAEGATGALDLLQACAAAPIPAPGFDSPTWGRVHVAVPQLLRLPGLRSSGRWSDLAAALEQLADMLPDGPFLAEAVALRRQLAVADAHLDAARSRIADGELDAARRELATVLAALPMHEVATQQLAALERSEREREQRLLSAREAARAGRLREAYALALADAGRGEIGQSAAQFAAELRSRMDLVQRGLDEVRAVIHGRTSSSAASLRHCLLRLEELGKLQSDHEELAGLVAGLESEVDVLELLEAALVAVDQKKLAPVVLALERLVAARSRFLAADRLDARALQLVDRLGQLADKAVMAGRLEEAEACARGIAVVGGLASGANERVSRLRAACEERRAGAAAKAEEAFAALERRDLRAAESACEAARQLWVDGGAPARLEAELAALRGQEAELEHIEDRRKAGDLGSAQVAMDALPPTSPLLRTRIFDMKKSLMQAQGLAGAFLLRVDEGGEFVVLRGESVSIGNLRDGTADLPILCAIAGKHARVQRSMSFHGGMQDSILAEGGDVRVGGTKVQKHTLKPGDRVQLGSALQVSYHVPCRRSLTAMLQLHGGFQVAGTDRVLLLKDRGRDGRICIGAGSDVHVRVGTATGEVELYGTKLGQIRVRCATGGDIDGRPFQDEHPVDAGAVVRAAGISFVLLPWSTAR